MRLEREDLGDARFAYLRRVQPANPYKVRLELRDTAALEEAIALSQRAYEVASETKAAS